jgi:ABC-type multidrug transport system permease subunit
VLFTIHQPASEIFNSFDRLILMNKGQVMYQGAVDEVPQYFADRGQPLPPKYNPGDWIMNVAQATPIEKLNDQGFFPQDSRELPHAFTDKDGKDEMGFTVISSGKSENFDSRPVGMITQTSMLFVRELKNIARDRTIMGGRLGFSLVLSTLIGIIFYDVGDQPSDISTNLNSHFGALIMMLMLGMMGTAQQALLSFPTERPVFLREYSTNHYSVASYFLSRLTVEAVVTALQILVSCLVAYWLISFRSGFGLFFLNVYALAMASTALSVALGCAVEDPKMASQMLPILFVPQLLFAGFFVAPSLMPSWLSWARYVFALTYSVRVGLALEFGDGCGSDKADMMCENLLESLDTDPDETWWYWMAMAAIFVIFRSLALFILRRKATKFF